jgi:hypothetical protein
MTQVGSTVGACDLNTAHIIIQTAIYCPGNFVVKRRPSAMGVEFVFRTVERGFAASANVGSHLEKIIVDATEGWLSAFMYDDELFLWC